MGRPDTISLSGVVTRQRPITANFGDVCVYRQDSRSGSRNRRGRHTNYGYSGFIKASVFDGSSWRNLKLDTFFNRESLSYGYQYDAEHIARTVIQNLAQKRGAVVRYDTQRKGFVLGGMPFRQW